MSADAEHRRRARLWPALRARPRLLGCILLGAALCVLSNELLPFQAATDALVGWNGGALLYLALAWHSMRGTSTRVIAHRAGREYEGRMMILALVVIGAAAVLLAVASQVSLAKDLHGAARAGHLGLAALTVFTSWMFTQVLFALHYAHDFYHARERGRPDPLQFPGTRDPIYGDFFYFACSIGTSGQTSDVSFTDSGLRAVGTLHCIESFFFNAALLGLTINALASLV